MYRSFSKRLFDIVFSALALSFFWPLLLMLAALVRIKLGSPVIFKQERPGLHGKVFTLYKFRSMTDQRDLNGNLLSDAERLTRFGKALRSTSLDELPELWNILKGDMSLVGPRPLLVQYLPLYSDFQRRRHEVRPGLTGHAQVNGRNAINWDEKFALDVWYVKHYKFEVDIKLIIKTVKYIFQQEGIHSGTSETMELFMGNADK